MCAIIGQGRPKPLSTWSPNKNAVLIKWNPGVKQWSPGALNPFGTLIGETHYVVQIGRQLSVQFFSTTTKRKKQKSKQTSQISRQFFLICHENTPFFRSQSGRSEMTCNQALIIIFFFSTKVCCLIYRRAIYIALTQVRCN